MSVTYHLHNDQTSVYFDNHDQYFNIGVYCYDDSDEELQTNPNKVRLSFDETDASSDVLKDGKTFEMELDITSWQDVAEMKATESVLIDEFIQYLGESEKQWFQACYDNSRKINSEL